MPRRVVASPAVITISWLLNEGVRLASSMIGADLFHVMMRVAAFHGHRLIVLVYRWWRGGAPSLSSRLQMITGSGAMGMDGQKYAMRGMISRGVVAMRWLMRYRFRAVCGAWNVDFSRKRVVRALSSIISQARGNWGVSIAAGTVTRQVRMRTRFTSWASRRMVGGFGFGLGD